MAALEVIALDTSVPQLMAPQAGDTYTFPRAVEMPLNTANGVLYLNGSKVVTSGSALTFDGTTLGVNGGLVADANLLVQMNSPAGAGRYFASNNAGGYGLLVGYDNSTTTARIRVIPNTPLTFEVNNSEQMRLTSTGLGIGTSSPGYKLAVSTAASTTVADFASVASGDAAFIGIKSSGGTYAYIGTVGGAMHFQTPGSGYSTKMLLDSSGNLGLGVTPSAWNADYKAIQVGANGSIAGRVGTSNSFDFTSNAYRDNVGGDWRYIASSGVSRYLIDGSTSAHYWFTAPSGTAGNAISFSQVMTLDASGNLGVGTTSPTAGYRLHLAGSSGLIRLQRDDAYIQFANTANTDTAYIQQTTSVFNIVSQVNGPIVFGTNSTERARITSGGDLLVGTISSLSSFSGARASFVGTTGFVAQTNQDATYECGAFWHPATSGDNTFAIFGTEATYTGRGSIDYDRAGGLVRYNTTSDYRAKDIIGPVQNPGATIDSLKVYEGVMKGATRSRPMLIAHEAQEHAPYAVSGVKDELNEDGTPKFQQMDVSSLVPLLLAEIQSLRARVAALEA